jgi:hypothetical protein
MTENTGFETYKLYHALKLHFTGSYDYFKYNGKSKVSYTNFTSSSGKYQFVKLSRKYNLEEMKDFLVANFIEGKGDWIGDLLSEGDDRYLKWQKRIQSLTYTFTNDIQHILETYADNREAPFKVFKGQQPDLLGLVLRGKVALETLCILDDILNFLPRWKKEITDDIIWPTHYRLFIKYKPFIEYDKEKFKNILKENIRTCGR